MKGAGRQFGARNVEPPECVLQMAEHPPACFDKRIWRLYLDSAYSSVLNEPAERMAMQRGVLPDYCSECLVGHRERKRAEGKCHPPAAALHQMELGDAA